MSSARAAFRIVGRPSDAVAADAEYEARQKKGYAVPAPPYQRMIDSPDVLETMKKELRRRAGKLHMVKQNGLGAWLFSCEGGLGIIARGVSALGAAVLSAAAD